MHFTIAALYVWLTLFFVSHQTLLVTKDSGAFLEASRAPLTSADFLFHFRNYTIPLFYKLLGQHHLLITWFQVVFACAASIFLAFTVAGLLQRQSLKVVGFAAVLLVTYGLDYIYWHRVLLSESINNSLFLLALALSLRLQSRPLSLSPRQQVTAGLPLGVVLFLWGGAATNTYFAALGLAGLLLLLAFFRWRVALRQVLLLALLVVPLLLAFSWRYYTGERDQSWMNGLMINITYHILPDPEKRDFMAARGMPTDAEALRFTGYVPPSRAGDWDAVFGDWLAVHGKRAFLDYQVEFFDEWLAGFVGNWNRWADPDALEMLKYNGEYQRVTLQRHYPLLIYNPGALLFVLAGLGAMLAAPWAFDRRWIPPLLMALAALPVVALAWQVIFETRHFVPASLVLRMGALLCALFALDRLFKRPLVLFFGVLMLLELVLGNIWLRDRVAYPLLSALAPDTNMLEYWGVDDIEYRLYRHVPLDEDVIYMRAQTYQGERYRRDFWLRWGLYTNYGEFVRGDDALRLTWRQVPRLLVDAPPMGPVHSEALEPQVAASVERWQQTLLPGYLAQAGIYYVAVDAQAWGTLLPYQSATLANLYRVVFAWDNGDILYQVNSTAVDWRTLAGGDIERLGLSDARYEQFLQTASPLLPAGVRAFDPVTGADATREQALLYMAGLTEIAADDLQDQRFALLGVLAQTDFEADLNTPPAALTDWRNSKAAADLQAAGYCYLLIDDQWWSWLSSAEQALIQSDYDLVTQWERLAPQTYWLYRVPHCQR